MNQAQALKLVPRSSPHPLAGKPVLESAPLRRGHKRLALSRFENDTWDLSPAVFRENARVCHVTAHFDGIEDGRVARTLREFLYARLNFDIPGHRTRLPPASIRQLFNRTRRFLEFVAEMKGNCNLARVDQATLDAYRNHLTADPQRRSVQVAHLLEVVVDLHHYREHMPSGGLELLPWKGRSAHVVAGAKQTAGENKTPRLPEAVIAPLLQWSLKYITVFSVDILAARAELEALEERHRTLVTEDRRFSPSTRKQRRRQRLITFLDQLRANGRGVPIWTTSHNGAVRQDPITGTSKPPVNALLIHLHIGLDAQAEPAQHVLLRKTNKALVLDAIDELGTEVGGMDTAISIDPDTGKPWRPRFDAKSLLLEERMLQAACYIVCAYLTGMRDCEVQAMRSGCLDVERSEDGLIERYRIKSTVYKRRDVRGQAEKWVTIEPVAKAITVLERLTEHIRCRRGGDTLWRVLGDHGSKDHISAEIVRQLNTFRDHLNAHFGTIDTPIVPPGTDAKPWRITTRQFRRTVAWHIANRPFGAVAGMIQYKHSGIAAYEGYAGSSRSGFRNEVERERALGQLDDVLTYFEHHRAGEVLMGPAAARISGELQQAADKIDPLPGHIADPARVRAMLAHVAKTLFVGVLSDCFFDPATALCLNGKSDHSTPAMAQCRPDRCPNSCITSRHRPLWAKAIADGEELLRTKRLSPLQREAIEADIARYRKAIREF
ncbi:MULTISPECIES: integrase [Hyphomicrobiales]|jgi:integrase|uniref:integrase n=1 Tax=Xanthobacter autotrophicus TaxID=280 RepID=UPI003726A479